MLAARPAPFIDCGAVPSFLLYLERKLGRFAIPGLVRLIVSIQAFVWLLVQLYPNDVWMLGKMMFSGALVLHDHEWWRCITFMFVPTGSSVLMLINVLFFWMISDGLEEAWGSFRVNLYVLACMVCVLTAGFLEGTTVATPFYILESALMAYAMHYPDMEIRLYGVIPLKMKWLALLAAGYAFFSFLSRPEMRGNIIASMIPFVVVYARGLRQGVGRRLQVMERRHRFASTQTPAGAALHRCAVCGKTDRDHPQLDFRVNAEGEDVCSDCRASAKKAASAAGGPV